MSVDRYRETILSQLQARGKNYLRHTSGNKERRGWLTEALKIAAFGKSPPFQNVYGSRIEKVKSGEADPTATPTAGSTKSPFRSSQVRPNWSW